MPKKKRIEQSHVSPCGACVLQDKLYKEIGFYSVMLQNKRLFADPRIKLSTTRLSQTHVRIVECLILKLWQFYYDAVGLCEHGQLLEKQ